MRTPEGTVDWSRVRNIGYVFMGLGVLAILIPNAATIAVEQLIAWLLVATGLSGLIFWWQLEGENSRWSFGATFACAFLLGLIFVFSPSTGAQTLTMILAALFLLEGIVTLLFGFRLKERLPQWIWFILSGATSLLMALIIISGWPGTATWVIGFLFGINLLTTGLSMIVMSKVGLEEIDVDLRDS